MTTFVPATEFTCPKCGESDCFLVSATCTAFVWGVGELQDVDNFYWEDDSEATCNNDGAECDWEGTVADMRAAATLRAAQDAATDAAAAAVRAATAARIEASADASTIELLAGSPVAAALREALADLASMATLASVSTLDEAQQHAEACRAACWSELDALTA